MEPNFNLSPGPLRSQDWIWIRGPGLNIESCELCQVLAWTNNSHDKTSSQYAAAQYWLEMGASPMQYWGSGSSSFTPYMIYEIVEHRITSQDFHSLLRSYMPSGFVAKAFKAFGLPYDQGAIQHIIKFLLPSGRIKKHRHRHQRLR
jgi:hypothetical protein